MTISEILSLTLWMMQFDIELCLQWVKLKSLEAQEKLRAKMDSMTNKLS